MRSDTSTIRPQIIPSVIRSICCLIFVFLLAVLTVGQQGTARGIQNSPNGPVTDALERRSREVALRSITMTGRDKPDSRANIALLRQMNEDFKQIQLVRLGMVNDIKDGKRFEYKRLSDDASEIRKRAVRLKVSLAFSEEKERPEQEFQRIDFDDAKIQDAASDLCLEISRFTENPMFRPGATFNVRYAAEAERALNTVINLSTNIKNSDDKLRKSN